jgi:hypothetical protein
MCSRAFSGNRCLLKRLGWRQRGFVRSHAKSTANRFRSASKQIGQSSLVSGTQDDAGAWSASNASCQRGAHRHHRSPGFRPAKPSSGTGVDRSFPCDLEKSRKLGSHHGADRVTADVLSPSVAAAVPIKACHGFDRADFKRLAEHVAGRKLPPPASTIPIIPQRRRVPQRWAGCSFHAAIGCSLVDFYGAISFRRSIVHIVDLLHRIDIGRHTLWAICCSTHRGMASSSASLRSDRLFGCTSSSP